MVDAFLRNTWYVAAWQQEVTAEKPLALTLLDTPCVLFRTAAGTYGLLEDQCPHRFAPLSAGAVEGEAIVCPYHGLGFGADGACIRNPFSDRMPPNARTRSFPVVAAHDLIWFWPGDPDLADPALIPDFSFLPGQDIHRGRSHIACDYRNLTDNLMDLSHVEFVHKQSFKPTGAFFRGEHEVLEEAGGTVWSNTRLPNVGRPDYLQGAPEGCDLDQWLEMRWNAPSLLMLRITYSLTGEGKDRPVVPVMWTPHIITPETATSCHYLWASHNSPEAIAMARTVFEDEDKPMLEAIQARMAGREFWSLKPVMLNCDTGTVRARRRLEALIRAESVTA